MWDVCSKEGDCGASFLVRSEEVSEPAAMSAHRGRGHDRDAISPRVMSPWSNEMWVKARESWVQSCGQAIERRLIN